MRSVYKLLDRPSLDWLLIASAALLVGLSPAVDWFSRADLVAQRDTMENTCSVLGTIAAFSMAALFFYAGLDNPTTRRVRARWAGRMSGVFLRALAVIVLGAFVSAFAGLGAPQPAATIVFFTALITSIVKVGRLMLVVTGLLRGQDHDVREKPKIKVRDTGEHGEPLTAGYDV